MTAPPKLTSLELPEPSRTRRARRVGALSPDDMLIFAAVVREGGVRRGAAALNVPRSTVSRQLAELERALGGKLITRSTRRFELTELGRALQVQCAKLEEVIEATGEVAARSAKEPTGLLKVAASPVVGEELFPEVVEEYLRLYPRVSLEVSLSVDYVDLRRGGFDLAIRAGTVQEATDLFATRLGVSNKGLYVSRAYLKAKGAPKTLAELSAHECIVIGHGPVNWQFRTGASEVEVQVNGRFRTDNYRLARSAAIEGVGIARLPRLFARPEVESGRLLPVLESDWPRTTLFAVHSSGSPAPPKIRAFIELAKVAMKKLL
jgi:DNA-binding transcriptional LysR family regulator